MIDWDDGVEHSGTYDDSIHWGKWVKQIGWVIVGAIFVGTCSQFGGGGGGSGSQCQREQFEIFIQVNGRRPNSDEATRLTEFCFE